MVVPAESETAPGRQVNRVWHWVFRIGFRLTPNRLMVGMTQMVPSLPLVEVLIIGRRSGLERRIVVTLFELDGYWYIGHPNGRSHWVHNLVAAGSATVVRRGERTTVTPVQLTDCAERDAVVAATSRQPFPANLLFRAARDHVDATGSYFRLEPASGRAN